MSYANAKSSIRVGGFYIEENCRDMVVPPKHANKIEIALGEIGENTIGIHKNGIEIDDKGRTTYVVTGKAGKESRIAKDKLRTVSARFTESKSKNTPTKTDKVK